MPQSQDQNEFIINPIDEDPISQDDVVEADVLYLTYDSFEDRGEISQEEMHVLLKFGVISGIDGPMFKDWNPNAK